MGPTMSPDLKLLLSKIVTRRDFSAWLKDLLDNDPAEIAAARTDQDLLYDYAKDYMREMGIERNESLGLFDFMDKRAAAKVLSGLPVAVYHGTSSALFPSIVQAGGLQRPRSKADMASPHKNSGAGVYVEDSGGSLVSRYALAATQRFGGDVVLLTIKTTLEELRADPDDRDLPGGRYQYVLDSVPLPSIVDVHPPHWRQALRLP
jgi:hypothetical protein